MDILDAISKSYILQFSSDVFGHVEVAASTVDFLKNMVFSLGKDSIAIDRQKWLMDSNSLLKEIHNFDYE